MRRVFEDINTERTMIRKLINFEQKRATLIYVT